MTATNCAAQMRPADDQGDQRRPTELFAFAPPGRRAAVFFFATDPDLVALDPAFFADVGRGFLADGIVVFFRAGATFVGDAARAVLDALRAFASFRITSGSSRSRHMYHDATDAYGAHRSPMRSTSFGVGSFGRR